MRIDALYVKQTQMPCSSRRPIVCSNQIASLCLLWLLFGWVLQQLMHRFALACSPSGKKERPPHVPFRSHSNWSLCSHYNPKPKTFVFEPFFLDVGCQKLTRLCRSAGCAAFNRGAFVRLLALWTGLTAQAAVHCCTPRWIRIVLTV